MDLILDNRVCLSRVNAYHQDAIRVSDLPDRVGRGSITQCSFQTLRHPSSSLVKNDLIRSDSIETQFLKKIDFLIGQAAGGHTSNSVRAVLVFDRFELLGHKSKSFLPGNFFEVTIHP